MDADVVDLPLVIVAPYPPPEEAPNWRGHWAAKSRAKKSYRFHARIRLGPQVSGQPRAWIAGAESIEVVLRMAPPMPKRGGAKRLRDRDNAQARCKTLLDVVAELVKVDDVVFRPRVVLDDPNGEGSVTVTLRPDRNRID